MTCTRGRDELYPTGSDGKIIYDDIEKASGAARELAKHGYGVQPPYPCPRSQHGHYHLTQGARDEVAARRERVERRERYGVQDAG
jgi:hypothetical protein